MELQREVAEQGYSAGREMEQIMEMPQQRAPQRVQGRWGQDQGAAVHDARLGLQPSQVNLTTCLLGSCSSVT